MSSRALLALVDELERSTPEVHSLMVVRHGAVLAEGWWAPYAADRGHQLFSLSKSFTSSAVGLAQADGLLTIDDLVLDHFPDEAPAEPGEHLARMRVRDLLTMTAGHDADPSDAVFAAPDWVRAFLAQPVALPCPQRAVIGRAVAFNGQNVSAWLVGMPDTKVNPESC